MKIQAYILLGGILPGGIDGAVDSVGMEELAKLIGTLPGVGVHTADWGNWQSVWTDILVNGGLGDTKSALIGYSGGGSRATWLANQYQPATSMLPHIDLLVAYDPSPSWQTLPLHDNIEKAICYYNLHPLMPSPYGMLGGGNLVAANYRGCKTILTRAISEQHLEVQFDKSLHAATVEAVKELL